MSKVGEMLRDERERQNLTFDDIEQSTSIRTRYLQAIEEGNFSVLPGDVYTKGFIRNYANILGLDGAEFVNMYNREIQGKPISLDTPKMDKTNNQVANKTSKFNNEASADSTVKDVKDTEDNDNNISNDKNANSDVDESVRNDSVDEVAEKQTITSAPPSYNYGPPKPPTVNTVSNTNANSNKNSSLTSNHIVAIVVAIILTVSLCVYFAFSSLSSNQNPGSQISTIDRDKEADKLGSDNKNSQAKKATFDLVKEGDKTLIVPTNGSRINEISLKLVMKKDTRGRIVTDGKELYVGAFYQGQESEWHAFDSILVNIEDSSAIDMSINGKKIDLSDLSGKQVEKMFVLQKKPTNSNKRKSQVRLVNEGGTITIVPLADNAKIDSVNVDAEFTKDCWTYVVADGKEIFSGMIKKGEKTSWQASEKLKVNFGDASAVKLTINGTEVENIGSSGEVLEKTIVIQESKVKADETKAKAEESKQDKSSSENNNAPYTVNYQNVPSRLVERGNSIIVMPKGSDSIKGLSVAVTMRDDCWTKVTADGRELYSGVLGAGDSMSWQANEQINISFENAGAVELRVNGNRVYGLGRKNEAIEKNIITQK